MSDELGDRMKMYEGMEAGRRLLPLAPILARIDGRAFHAFTRGMKRPFDDQFVYCMTATTRFLVQETNACMGYTQSDEITLAWHSTNIKSQVWFDGRIHKMVSQLAAQATLEFNEQAQRWLPDFSHRRPTFDARVWTVPNRTEGANAFLWREWDATKNSVSMAADALYSHNELHGKNGAEKQDMLMAKGINWNDYPPQFKRGVYVQRRILTKPFTPEEIESLPPKHQARANPDLTVERSEWRVIDLPPLGSITNREAVIFEGAEPSVSSQDSGSEAPTNRR